MGRDYQEIPHFFSSLFKEKSVVKCGPEEFECPCGICSQRDCVFIYSNDIDKLVEEPITYQRRAFGVALCFTVRRYGGEFVRGGRGNSKAAIL
ncbi:hypothetical protein AVEN_267880-1 [Araneus ventricosus]|uniref:Uncharacterized protein n=1 Tax=Araneus ventricosus TaxID=182803 RepID=A0A4Y2H7D7_ARAVE|nr:hypothetical protein AVEN_267880-1 [Araneus ventricosus]